MLPAVNVTILKGLVCTSVVVFPYMKLRKGSFLNYNRSKTINRIDNATSSSKLKPHVHPNFRSSPSVYPSAITSVSFSSFHCFMTAKTALSLEESFSLWLKRCQAVCVGAVDTPKHWSQITPLTLLPMLSNHSYVHTHKLLFEVAFGMITGNCSWTFCCYFLFFCKCTRSSVLTNLLWLLQCLCNV